MVFVCGKRYSNPNLSNVTYFIIRYSVLLAICLDGIPTVKILEGSFDSDSFVRFIDGLLCHMNQFSGPNFVVVMDNCCIHKSDLVLWDDWSTVSLILHLTCCTSSFLWRGMHIEFLPPYSPNYNPNFLKLNSCFQSSRWELGQMRQNFVWWTRMRKKWKFICFWLMLYSRYLQRMQEGTLGVVNTFEA